MKNRKILTKSQKIITKNQPQTTKSLSLNMIHLQITTRNQKRVIRSQITRVDAFLRIQIRHLQTYLSLGNLSVRIQIRHQNAKGCVNKKIIAITSYLIPKKIGAG